MTDSVITWQQKLAAIQSLLGMFPLSAYLNNKNVPMVSCNGGNLAGNGLLSSIRGLGATAEEAVNSAWEQMTPAAANMYVQVSATDYRARWNGFMWEPVKP